MFLFEIIAVIFSLACVVLTIKRNIWCWPIGIIGTIAYAVVFFTNHLNADFLLQFVFIGQGILGWWYWANSNKQNTLSITRLNPILAVRLLGISIMVYMLLVFILWKFTNSSAILVDSFVVVGSILANWLLIRKKLESWVVWIIVDMIYIGLFLYKGLYMSSGLYIIFLLLAIQGLYTWNKNLIHYKNGNL